MDEILEQVRRNTGLSITETQVERILQGKSCSMPAEVVSLIEKQGRLYIEKILSAITEAGFDLRAVPSIFMGGGAANFSAPCKYPGPPVSPDLPHRRPCQRCRI